jgi:integrase
MFEATRILLPAELRARLARAAITLAEREAEKHVKRQIAASGKKLSRVPTREIFCRSARAPHCKSAADRGAKAGRGAMAEGGVLRKESCAHCQHSTSMCGQSHAELRDFSMSTHAAEVAKGSVMRPVRKPNAEYRVREHLTESEIEKLLAALRRNRNGQRDWLIGLMIYRHGLRVSEACDLRWDDIDLAARTIVIRRLKGSRDSTHYLERDELGGLRRLPRKGAYVFVNERWRSIQTGRDCADGTACERRCAAALPHPRAYAAPRLRLRPGEQGDGYAQAPALPRAREHHEHGEVFGDEPGTVQGFVEVRAVARGYNVSHMTTSRL